MVTTDGWTRRDFIRRTSVVGAAAIGSSILLSACGESNSAEDVLEKGRKQGFLRVGVANEPPYTKVTAENVTGVEPDILRTVLKRLGIDRIEGVITPYDQMIPGLQAGRWDVVAAGLFMKQSRCGQVLYSEPTIVSTESFGVPKGNPKKITTLASIKDHSDLKIAVLSGGFEEGILKQKGMPAGQQIQVRDGRSGIEAVKSGRAHAFFLPTLSLEDLVKSDKAIEVTKPVDDAPVTGAGHCFREKDKAAHDKYNKELAALKKTPEFGKILEKWGFHASDVEGVTTKQLCKTSG